MFARKEIRQYWLFYEMHTRSIALTRRLARRYGETFGFVYVGGYSKSGTTWVSRIVGDYLDLPVPRDYALPPAFRCVIHHHWEPEPALERTIYVVRDGRDAMVSEYMNMMRGVEARRERVARFGRLSAVEEALLLRYGRDARWARRMDRCFGEGFDPWDVAAHLPVFIEANLERPLSEVVPLPWHRHVETWSHTNAPSVRYEDVLSRPLETLEPVLERLTGDAIDRERLVASIARQDFARRTGRPHGVENRSSLERKGIAGDWRNHFDRRAAEVFERHAGAQLVASGYEPDGAWVRELPG